jgi:DNA-binding CsgD family transcriptional regulator
VAGKTPSLKFRLEAVRNFAWWGRMVERALVASLESLIEQIYESAVVPDAWPKALAALADLADAAFASLVTFDKRVLRWTGTPDAIALIDSYKSVEAILPNPRLAAMVRNDHAGFVTDFELLSRNDIEKSRFYTDFLRPRGYGWVVGIQIKISTGQHLIMSAERKFERGPVEAKYVRLLDGLRPHYARAAMLATSLELARAAAMAKVLDILRLPAAVLQASGSLSAANEPFFRLVPSVFQDRRRRLSAKDERLDLLLEAALARRRDEHRAVQSIPVPASSDQSPMVVHIIPVCGQARDIFAGVVYLLIVTPVYRRSAAQTSVIQGLFGLTPSEARVAKKVAEAHSVDAIAFDLGLTRETVRTRLKSILRKTGLHRQSELANLLAGSSIDC